MSPGNAQRRLIAAKARRPMARPRRLAIAQYLRRIYPLARQPLPPAAILAQRPAENRGIQWRIPRRFGRHVYLLHTALNRTLRRHTDSSPARNRQITSLARSRFAIDSYRSEPEAVICGRPASSWDVRRSKSAEQPHSVTFPAHFRAYTPCDLLCTCVRAQTFAFCTQRRALSYGRGGAGAQGATAHPLRTCVR